MDAASLEARRRRSQQAFYRRLPGVELPGAVWAAVTPGVPERSFVNAVTYADAEAVVAARDELAAIYDRAGVRAWTVWVPEGDEQVASALARAGHVLDATPAAMGCELAGLDLDGEDPGPAPDWAGVRALNEAAFGYPPGQLAGLPEPADVRIHGVAGQAALLGFSCEGDCGIEFVATAPPAQRRGLATALMRQALRHARAAGCTTATLVATRAGRPVYERVGFRVLGTLQMWEHRV